MLKWEKDLLAMFKSSAEMHTHVWSCVHASLKNQLFGDWRAHIRGVAKLRDFDCANIGTLCKFMIGAATVEVSTHHTVAA